MEGAADESVPEFYDVPEGADGCCRRISDMGGDVVYTVPVLSVAGCELAVRLVARVAAVDEENVPDAKPSGCAAACSRGAAATGQYGHGLLDLHTETAWLFLCDNDRNDDGGGSSLGFPHDFQQMPVSCHLPCDDLCRGLSTGGHLWSGSHVAHGTLGLEAVGKTQ